MIIDSNFMQFTKIIPQIPTLADYLNGKKILVVHNGCTKIYKAKLHYKIIQTRFTYK